MQAGSYPPRDLLHRNRARDVRERTIQAILLVAASIGAVTTAGIILALAGETLQFFREVSIVEFFTSTQWSPTFSEKNFGIWPLITGTLLTSAIALAIAIPLGLVAATYLSEFADPRARNVLKPALEILAGIPTIVYGFFALLVVTPQLQRIIPGLSSFNALSAGIVMGIMIVPLVSSLSEDSMSAVPRSLREAAYGLGATRFEVAWRVVFPAAISGIVASVILALSRAVGETMVVAIAAGYNPTFTLDPTVPIQTMTTYIVQVSLGDTPFGSIEYLTIFAVGFTLFVMTFLMNIVSHWVVARFREVYD